MVKIIPFFAFFVILFSLPLPLRAESAAQGGPPEAPVRKQGNYVFSLGFKSGILRGSTRELVYQNTGSGDLLSRLDWELHPLYYLGANLGIGPREPKKRGGFFAGLGFAAGIPLDNGTLEDRDWEYSLEPQRLTKFSSHPSSTERCLLLDYRAGFSLPLGRGFAASLFIFFSWNHFSWTARDGYAQYTQGPHNTPGAYPERPWGSDLPKDYGSFRGKQVIRYTQDWFIPGLGGSLDFPLPGNFDGGFSVLISPLVFAVDNDEHLLTHWVYRNYVNGGFFFEGSFSLAFSVSRTARLRLKTSYSVITGIRGDTYIWFKGVLSNDISDAAGIDMSYAGVELVFEWFFR
jgi:outer membrane protease